MKLANHHPSDLWGADARNAAREEQHAAVTLRRELASALREITARHHPVKRPMVRCPSCEEPGFVGAVCGCGWQL